MAPSWALLWVAGGGALAWFTSALVIHVRDRYRFDKYMNESLTPAKVVKMEKRRGS